MKTYYEFIIGGLAVYSLMAAWQIHKMNTRTKELQKRTSRQQHPTALRQNRGVQ